MKEIVKTIKYEGKPIYCLVKTRNNKGKEVYRFEPILDDIELEEILLNMPLEEKLNLTKPLDINSKLYGMNYSFITSPEIVDFIYSNNIIDEEHLERENNLLYKIAKERGISKKIFPNFPALLNELTRKGH